MMPEENNLPSQSECRLCKKTGEDFYPIDQFYEILRVHISMQISPDDEESKVLCFACIRKIADIYNFKERCLKIQSQVSEWVEEQAEEKLLRVKSEATEDNFNHENFDIENITVKLKPVKPENYGEASIDDMAEEFEIDEGNEDEMCSKDTTKCIDSSFSDQSDPEERSSVGSSSTKEGSSLAVIAEVRTTGKRKRSDSSRATNIDQIDQENDPNPKKYRLADTPRHSTKISKSCDIKNTNEKKKFPCDFCEIYFFSQNALNSHVVWHRRFSRVGLGFIFE